MNITAITGIAASILTATSLLPQLGKLASEKKAKNISAGMLVILLTGLICWVIYGGLKKDYIILTANSFSLLITVITLCLTLKYKDKK